ncbi:tetratricopeptide repeat protein [Streptomyces sp. NPDC091368]|uniref:tetratricopeptide repeat protein n=1 Tax=Streptomyces sp. NPDC091368 TaxID=3365993 RepID=UPI00380CC68C
MRGRADASGDRSVAAGGDIGKVVTGDFSTQIENGVVLPAALPVPDSGLVHLPERTALFVGRARELARLDAGTPSGVQVLCGLGGIGKSTLAAHWAAGRLDSHNPVWWITAETAGELDAGLAALARAMQPAYVGVLPDDALRERALQWLAGHDDWLLILDNVSDPADVKPLLARAARGRVLITTRRATGWQDLAETIPVPELDPEEAAALFTRVCPGDGVPEVCAELGHLPLALRQAAAYCSEAGISARAYLDLLARYPAETYALTAEGGEAGRTVARVWQVTLDRLADTSLAGRILAILAWWAPEGIPRRLLEPLGSPLEVTEAVRRLRAHSMIGVERDSLTVHRLVQAVVRTGGEGREEAGALLARATSEVRGSPSENLEVLRPLAAQAASLAQHTEPDEDPAKWCVLFHWAGMTFGMTTDRRAHALFVRAWLGYARLYGEESEPALQVMGALVVQQQFDGAPGSADLSEEHFELHVRLYGPDDTRTIEARTQLAKALLPTDPLRASELLRENVDRAARSLGEDDAVTLGARRALLDADPDPEAACAGLEALLARAGQVLPEDADLIDSIERSLVGTLLDLGRTDRALALTEAGAAGARTRFGPTHPNTLVRRGFHVFVLTEAGELDRARHLVRDLLHDCEAALDGTTLTMMVRQLAHERLSSGD